MTVTVRGRALSTRAAALVGLALAAPSVPLLVALLARRHPPWVPHLDLALTELRVRDVGGPHSPEIGLPGRFGSLQRQGSHPGPVSFYLLAPLYRLLGSTSFALQVSTVMLHLAGAWTAVVLTARRAGSRWALAVGGGLAVLVTGLGPNLFTEPWNPHLPVLWWPAFLVAAWCALGGDVAVLPVLVLSGAICAQTHVSYLGAVGLLTVAATLAALLVRDRPPVHRRWTWVLGAVLLGSVLWAPPVLDQLRHDPGNARLVAEHLLDPPEPAVGLGTGLRSTLERLDLVQLARGLVDPGRLAVAYPAGASAARGGLLVAVWLVVVARAWGAAPRHQRSLTALAGVGLLLAVLSLGRIVGQPWSYLMLWVWPVTIVVLLSLGAALRGPGARRWDRALRGGLVVAVVAVSLRAAVAAGDARSADPVLDRGVTAMVPPVVESLDRGARYLVTWTDAVNLGGYGYGMVDELERRGVDVVVRDDLATQFGRHRTQGARRVAGQIVVATGTAIERWEQVAGARLVVRIDARTAAERRDATRTRAALVAELRRSELAELVPVIDENLYGVAFDRRLTPVARALAEHLGALGAPAAVLLVPAGAALP